MERLQYCTIAQKDYITVFLDCLNTILTALFCFSIHLTQLAQPHTGGTNRIQSYAMCVFHMVTKYGFVKLVYSCYKSVSFCNISEVFCSLVVWLCVCVCGGGGGGRGGAGVFLCTTAIFHFRT